MHTSHGISYRDRSSDNPKFGLADHMDLIPIPSQISTALAELIFGAGLAEHLIPSVLRVAAALALSAVIGIPIGFIAASRSVPGVLTSGSISAIRYLPPTAFIGLLILAVGIGSQTAIALMVIGVAPYVAIMTSDAFRGVPAEHVEVAQVFGATRSEIFWKVIIPYVTPRLIDAVKVNVGAAWTFLIVAEIIAGNSGIGYLMARAQRFLNIQELYALLLICGVSGLLMDQLLEAASRFFGRWSRNALN